MKQLMAGELPLRKIFCSDYDFAIPDYQRPYAWQSEQALQLLDDLDDALGRDEDDPYFLGSVVLVKQGDTPAAQVIDGQQRLTTLTILLSILRDLTENTQLSAELKELVEEPGRIMDGTRAKPRLRLRKRDADFFAKYVQTAGNLDALVELPDHALGTDAQRAIRDNTRALRNRLLDWPETKRQALATMLGQRTLLVVVSTPDLASAHRIFSVMNARGLDLSPADIFKADVIGAVPPERQADYADKWEDAEQDLGRDTFAALFLDIRMIFARERARRELLKEFPTQVLREYLPSKATVFVDDVLLPYADAIEHVVNQDFPGPGAAAEVNNWLRRLAMLDNNDWRAPALWALRHHREDVAFLVAYLQRLERLAASMLLRRVYATPRAQRYADLLKSLDRGTGLDAAEFDLTDAERAATRTKLEEDIYLVQPVRKYVLLRLDELLAKTPGVSYDHKLITVEHILPQNPAPDSEWSTAFTEDERTLWTHKLGNLVLLNRAKNSEAQNYDFVTKKAKYFTGKNGVSTFALTSQVLGSEAWTPEVLQARQERLVGLLATEWNF